MREASTFEGLTLPCGLEWLDQRYTVQAAQSGKWWVVWVEGVPGAMSQGETLLDALLNVRNALADLVLE